MRCALATVALVGLASAAPACPANPNLSSSKGLKLRVQLADPSRDLSASPVAGQYVTSIHDGAGTNLVGFSATAGRDFYVNGTGADGLFWNTVSDGGTPLAPYSFSLHALPDNADVQAARLDVGEGDRDIYVPEKDAHPQLYPTGWLACSEPLAYYAGKIFNVLRRNAFDKAPPAECVPVVLLPECAELEQLPGGALSSHEFAKDVTCYKDASKA